jgi:hypothetical protein
VSVSTATAPIQQIAKIIFVDGCMTKFFSLDRSRKLSTLKKLRQLACVPHRPQRREAADISIFRLWRLSPFPFAGLPVVAGNAALDHFIAPLIARHDERGEIATAKAKPAKGDHDDDLQQHFGTSRAISMLMTTPCNEYKQRQSKRESQAKSNSDSVRKTVLHGIYIELMRRES